MYFTPWVTGFPACTVHGFGTPSGSALFQHPVGVGVVPDQQCARQRPDRDAQVRKTGLAASVDLVEENHGRERPLPAAFSLSVPVGRTGWIPIGVWLEFLALEVTLALDGLAE
jgi:hypothetical protein